MSRKIFLVVVGIKNYRNYLEEQDSARVAVRQSDYNWENMSQTVTMIAHDKFVSNFLLCVTWKTATRKVRAQRIQNKLRKKNNDVSVEFDSEENLLHSSEDDGSLSRLMITSSVTNEPLMRWVSHDKNMDTVHCRLARRRQTTHQWQLSELAQG